MVVWMVVQITMGVTETLFAQPVVFGCLEMVVQITIVELSRCGIPGTALWESYIAAAVLGNRCRKTLGYLLHCS